MRRRSILHSSVRCGARANEGMKLRAGPTLPARAGARVGRLAAYA